MKDALQKCNAELQCFTSLTSETHFSNEMRFAGKRQLYTDNQSKDTHLKQIAAG